MKTKPSPKPYCFIRLIEDRILYRTGRATILEDLDIISLEQLDYFSKHHSTEQLEKALNAMLEVIENSEPQ